MGVVASSWSTSTTPPDATTPDVHAASSGVVRTSSTCGTRARRACLAASRAVTRHRSRPLTALAPLHTDTHR